MEWIRDERRPDVKEKLDYSHSKNVVILDEDGETFVAEYNTGTQDGDKWEQWYSRLLDDTIGNVVAWCDCIPEIK